MGALVVLAALLLLAVLAARFGADSRDHATTAPRSREPGRGAEPLA
ncbi:hypothetical protein EV189_2216 [Motilibacter rhizosphaerae]|uniref:Uncharacterized protein n=1 Tax=Motilibacter rhizosphaerae TaxID=598652 RepID=A0A4Q7NQE3_9ACTN|nr:hypothetical protein [Motilibacter rhizosphaerae]RZS86800.1 hypothetical protein EV189_2216 [Motilibacter rhizosphaerae]